jgi:hypothetical protein
MDVIGAATPTGAPVPVAPISSYKSRKEAFVSDLSGGSILEVNLVTLVAPVSPQSIWEFPPAHRLPASNPLMVSPSNPKKILHALHGHGIHNRLFA